MLESQKRKERYTTSAQQLVIDYLLDHPCVDCGETDPVVLEFDHRDPTYKEFNIGAVLSRVSAMDHVKLKDEMDKCDIRCANCHRRRTSKSGNYKRYRMCVEQHIIDY